MSKIAHKGKHLIVALLAVWRGEGGERALTVLSFYLVGSGNQTPESGLAASAPICDPSHQPKNKIHKTNYKINVMT